MRTATTLAVLAALGACGDNLHPESDQLTAVSDEGDTGDDDGGGEEEPVPTLFVTFGSDPGSCDDHTVLLFGRVSPENESAICQWDFGDGTTAFGCFAVHSFPEARTVTLTARDPVTGAIGSYSEEVIGPASFDATADVTTDGRSISWDVHTNYGGVLDVGSAQVFIEPGSGNWINGLQGTVQVPAGTYQVTVNAYITFGEEGGCNRMIEKTIEVNCEKE